MGGGSSALLPITNQWQCGSSASYLCARTPQVLSPALSRSRRPGGRPVKRISWFSYCCTGCPTQRSFCSGGFQPPICCRSDKRLSTPQWSVSLPVWPVRACRAKRSVRRARQEPSGQSPFRRPAPQPKLPLVISDFYFDLPRVCVSECIPQCLACNPIDVVPNWSEIPRGVPSTCTQSPDNYCRFGGQRVLLRAC